MSLQEEDLISLVLETRGLSPRLTVGHCSLCLSRPMDAFLPESFCPRQHFSAAEWPRLSWVNCHSGNMEGFGKHLRNLGAPRVGQYMIALGLKSKSQLPGRGQVPSVGSSEDRTVFWGAEGLSWGISQHLPQLARSGTRSIFDNRELHGQWLRLSPPVYSHVIKRATEQKLKREEQRGGQSSTWKHSSK